MGPKPLEAVSRWMNKMTGHFVPVWNPYMPKGAAPLQPATASPAASEFQVRRAPTPSVPSRHHTCSATSQIHISSPPLTLDAPNPPTPH
jgi:hypothetical protein